MQTLLPWTGQLLQGAPAKVQRSTVHSVNRSAATKLVGPSVLRLLCLQLPRRAPLDPGHLQAKNSRHQTSSIGTCCAFASQRLVCSNHPRREGGGEWHTPGDTAMLPASPDAWGRPLRPRPPLAAGAPRACRPARPAARPAGGPPGSPQSRPPPAEARHTSDWHLVECSHQAGEQVRRPVSSCKVVEEGTHQMPAGGVLSSGGWAGCPSLAPAALWSRAPFKCQLAACWPQLSAHGAYVCKGPNAAQPCCSPRGCWVIKCGTSQGPPWHPPPPGETRPPTSGSGLQNAALLTGNICCYTYRPGKLATASTRDQHFVNQPPEMGCNLCLMAP